jgi:amidase
MVDALHYLTLTELSEALRRRTVSSVEATSHLLNRIAALDSQYRSYATVMADAALAEARAADAEIGNGRWRGPLHGVPIAVKDLCFTKNAPTAAGMAILKDWVPDYDATVVTKLNQAGAVTLGKLQLTEGATGSHHPTIAPPCNPWSHGHWTGVSSSGSGVATAAGLCFGSLGSDTGGSIRFPSSCCNLTGIKPTWGRVSRNGIFTLADSQDHIGPMARSTADAAAILGVIAGDDPNDQTTLPAPVPDYLVGLGNGVGGLRVGIDRAYNETGTDAEIVAALAEIERVLVGLGMELKPVGMPRTMGAAVAVCMPAMSAEVAAAHAAYYPARKAEYGPELAGMIELGMRTPATEIAEAARLRRVFRGEFARLWRDIDLLLVPAMPMTVPTIDTMAKRGRENAFMAEMVRFTMPFDLTGSPTITLPGGFTKRGLPIGFQLAGPDLSEDLLCRAGFAFQQVTDWHTRHPDVP